MTLRFLSKGWVQFAPAQRTKLGRFILGILLAFSMPAHAVVLSNRPTAAAFISPGDDRRFDGVGRIECHDPRNGGGSYLGTAWLLESADTVVTAAHILFRGASSDSAVTNIISPRHCIFALYGPDQEVRQIAMIRYALSPWAVDRFRSDSSYDLAVLKLDRPMKVDQIPIAKIPKVAEKASVSLIAFHSGIGVREQAWITKGLLRTFPVQQLRFGSHEMRITKASRLFSTSADSTPGSSGGMYYDEQMQAAIGIHVGHVCEQSRPSFDPDACFNYGLRFDKVTIALVDAVAQDRPLADYRVVPDDPSNRFALRR